MVTVDEFCPCSMSVFVSLAPSTRSSNSSFKLIIIPSKLLTETKLVVALLLTSQNFSHVSLEACDAPVLMG